MALIRRTAFLVFGIIFTLLGIPRASEMIAAWNENFAFVQAAFENPLVYAATVFLAVALLTSAATDFLLERKLVGAGGPTKREFPAKLDHWTRVQSFPLREALWLWHGLEPNSGSFESTRVLPTYRRVEQALKGGALKDVKPTDDDWLETTFTRQQLVDLAIHLGDAPRFLIPSRMIAVIKGPPIDDAGFTDISFAEFLIIDEAKKRDPSIAARSSEDVRAEVSAEVTKWLIAGTWEAVARERIDGVLYPFVRIPAAAWRRASRQLFAIIIDGREFESVQIRQVQKDVSR